MAVTNLSAKLIRSSAPLTANVDDEVVMLDPASSRYFGLATTGVRIWELLESPRSPAEIIDVLLGEYEVDRDACATSVLSFLSSLADAGLVTAAGVD